MDSVSINTYKISSNLWLFERLRELFKFSFYQKGKFMEMKRKAEKKIIPQLPKCPQWLELNQTKARSQDSWGSFDLPHECRIPMLWVIHCSQAINRDQERKWSSWEMSSDPHGILMYGVGVLASWVLASWNISQSDLYAE